MEQVSGRITLINVAFPGKALIKKLDSFFYRTGIDYSLTEIFFLKKLKRFINEWKPAVIHSHLFKPDYYVSLLRRKKTTEYRHVITNHGDYLLFENQSPGILNYQRKLNATLSKIDQAVVISDEQMHWMLARKQTGKHVFDIHRILNGYSSRVPEKSKQEVLEDLNIDNGDFVYGMVARGIKEKGWENLIKAFQQLPFSNIKLVLIGSGEAITSLKSRYEADRRIIFTGYLPDPVSYIQAFDVCLLPSYYKAESLPTVIIEYLAGGKAVIATEIGEVKNMLITPSGELAGIVVKYTEDGPDETGLTKAMQEIFTNLEMREHLNKMAPEAFRKFDMPTCVNAYLDVYKHDR